MRGRDDVGIRDEPTARADEPPGARLAERLWLDRGASGAAAQCDVGADLGDDERNGRLGAQQDFLETLRLSCCRRRGDNNESERYHATLHASILAPRSITPEKRKAPGVFPRSLRSIGAWSSDFISSRRSPPLPSTWRSSCHPPCTRPPPPAPAKTPCSFQQAAWRQP